MEAIALDVAQGGMLEGSMTGGMTVTEPEHSEGKVFIGGLSWETTSDSLRYYFEKFGELSDVALMANKRTGQPRGFGFVSYKDEAAVDIVLAQPSHNIDGRTVDVKRAVPRSQAPANTSGGGRQESKKIFVGGLSPEVTETEFNEYFAKFGTLQDSIVMYDKKTSRSRGFGFVTFETEEGVQAVLNAEHEIMGKWVEIKRAEPRDLSRNSMDGGYGGYGHGGGRGGPMRGGMGGRGMHGRGGYDDYGGGGGYGPQYGGHMGGGGGRGGGGGYGYGGYGGEQQGGYGGGGGMGGRGGGGGGGGQGYMGYGYGGASMPAGGYYGQSGGGGDGYAGYG
jgi:heterogeneous nuclear ribonucleoprotein A1/A3